jgi:hypothetical protein
MDLIEKVKAKQEDDAKVLFVSLTPLSSLLDPSAK